MTTKSSDLRIGDFVSIPLQDGSISIYQVVCIYMNSYRLMPLITTSQISKEINELNITTFSAENMVKSIPLDAVESLLPEIGFFIDDNAENVYTHFGKNGKDLTIKKENGLWMIYISFGVNNSNALKYKIPYLYNLQHILMEYFPSFDINNKIKELFLKSKTIPNN